MTKSATRKKQKKEAAETKFRTREEQLRGAVGKKNYSKYNPGNLNPFHARPDDASKARTRKEQEQAKNERFISPTKGKVRTELGKQFGLGAGSIDRKTGKQIVSKDRDIPTRAQEKERAKLAKEAPVKKAMGGVMKNRGGTFKGTF